MKWERIEVASVFLEKYTAAMLLPVAGLFFLILPNSIFSYLFIVYYLLFACTYLYVLYMERSITIKEIGENIRLFPAEQANIRIAVENGAKLPVINSSYVFRVDSSLISQLETEKTSKGMCSISFSQSSRSSHSWDFPFLATQRGTFSVKAPECIIRDPFHLMELHLPLGRKSKVKIIVYPTLQPVVGLQKLIQFEVGDYQTAYSIYKDEAAIIGIKTYEGESFRSIHWKASARKQELQAKQYQPVFNHTWTIVLCLSSEVGFNWKTNLETLISRAAYICKLATEKNIPIELFISILGEGGVVHVPLGSGNKHYIKIMEVLAAISYDNDLIAREQFFRYLARTHQKSSLLLFIGVSRQYVKRTLQPTYIVTDAGGVERL
ncbi:DUF58 domain-containing protein [Microbacteriaceae bacterium 4G12]